MVGDGVGSHEPSVRQLGHSAKLDNELAHPVGASLPVSLGVVKLG